MKSLSDITQKIVDERHKSKKDFRDRKKELDKFVACVTNIDNLENDPNWETVLQENDGIDLWKRILSHRDELSTQLNNFLRPNGLFDIAKARTDRDYVNIGAIGITKEGKSEFNAKIAGLHSIVMPRKGGTDSCTTASINVINGSKDGKKEFVRVYHYSASQLAQLFASFLEELGNNSYKDELLSITTEEKLNKWVKANTGDITKSNVIGRGILGSKKEAFCEYLTNYNQYRSQLFDEDSLEKNPDGSFIEVQGMTFTDYDIAHLTDGEHEKEAEEYYSSVSYYKNPGDKKKIYTSYSTRRAEVFTSFSFGKEGPIANLQFLDTPGIGEEKPGLERILAKSVSSNLDIVLAIRAAKPNEQTQSKRNLLVTQLRTHLNNKPKTRESVYFIVNPWGEATWEDGEEEKRKLIQRLKSPQDLDPIILDDDHFKIIHIPENKEFIGSDRVNTVNPLQTYLQVICNKLLPLIGGIDNEYFEDAVKEYNAICKKYETLLDAMSELAQKLPSTDISRRINNVLRSVGAAWLEANARLRDSEITGEISYSIQEFCDQPTGKVLAKFFNTESEGVEKFDPADDNIAFIEAFCTANERAIRLKYDQGGWIAFDDFTRYTELKKDFLRTLAEDIFSRIKVDVAQKALDAEKRNLASLFMNQGRLNVFEKDPSLWWSAIAEVIKSMKYAPIHSENGEKQFLHEMFSSFAEFSIDYRKILGLPINKILEKCGHSDNFGSNWDIYNFTKHENATRAIIHSLLCIEFSVQDQVKQSILKDEMESVMTDFRKMLNRLRQVNIYGQQQELTKEREQWEQFYKDHARILFADDDEAKKNALIDSWKSLTKQ